MNLELEIVNPLKVESWDKLFLGVNDFSFFHSSAWARVLYEEYRYKPCYFALIDSSKPLALLPFMEVNSWLTGRRAVSLPFTDHYRPIISNTIASDSFLTSIINYGKMRGWKSIELRDAQFLPANEIHSEYYYDHTLSIQNDEEQMLSSFRSSTRRNINKAVKEGVEVRICRSLASVKEFYRLHLLTRKRHGLPSQPYSFFDKVFKYVISMEYGIVLVATYENKPIAASIFFHLGDKAIYKYAASDKKYLCLRPNNLIMWEAIKWYARNGFSTISLGRTEPANFGLRRFKSSWGAIENTLSYYRYDMRKEIFVRSHSLKCGLLSRVFQRTPGFLLRFIGSIAYKHIG